MKRKSILQLALEADDITKEVSTQMKATEDKDEPDDDGQEDDIERTDDIFGTKAFAEKNKAEKAENDTPDGTEETTDDQNPPDEEDNTEGEEETPEDTDENTDTDQTTEEASNVDEIATPEQRQILKENMITLLTMFKGQLNTLNSLEITDNSPQNRTILYKLRENHTSAIDILTKKITVEFPNKSYISLLQTYIMMKQLMDVNADMLDKFLNIANITKPIKKQRNSDNKNVKR